ncbi:type II toxin-antitoxin system death-on-curing family toxin [Sphingosinicella microcystinivorans]|uniref:type II toxin-antitoxin system death-on-curing family toxin n=1 Tax=Sphingosinicella microcystinivorans TaxID=335406 RepID=UPI0022F3A030|nr:type II toxin-antitoxin system death-on-curing family toxin [Sphingosinicella microcystinivorans]WBX83947.1 type II toxin-antitoxin system death-on-curing family toxin [Sphingosinicella microcystinivorans]
MTNGQRVEPVWLDKVDAVAIHDRQLAEHGGGSGVRDAGLLDSALARPVNRWVYGDDDPATLAAAYAFGVARNHPFVDGNKRTAWVLARLFLALNGHELRFGAEDAIGMMLDLASGALAEAQVAEWFRSRLAVTRS